MKKLFAIITVVCMLLSVSVAGYAQTYTNNQLGMSFVLSDDWSLTDESADAVLYTHTGSSNEGIRVGVTAIDGAYDIDLIDESIWEDLCMEWYSDERLAAGLNEANNTYGIRVKTESIQSRYETIGGTKYYRFEKAYTASGNNDFYDQGFYDTVFMTAKNGRVYEIAYGRDDDLNENNYADVAAMLASISYAEGETKIIIDGERIYPDSTPMIISGRTLVPIRAVAEKLGYNVGWNDATQTVTMLGKHDLAFTINSQVATKNFERFELDVPAILFNSRTYLPLRAVTEAMDAQVRWSEEENTVYITSSAY